MKIRGVALGNVLLVGAMGLGWLALAAAATAEWAGVGGDWALVRLVNADAGGWGRRAVLWSWAGFATSNLAWAVVAAARFWASRPWCFPWLFCARLWWLALLGYSALALTASAPMRFEVGEVIVRVMAGATSVLALVAWPAPGARDGVLDGVSDAR